MHTINSPGLLKDKGKGFSKYCQLCTVRHHGHRQALCSGPGKPALSNISVNTDNA